MTILNKIIDYETTFKENKNIKYVDLGYAEFNNNDMSNAFYNCTELKYILNINENVTTMYKTFYRCNNLIKAPTIPNSVTNIEQTFSTCINLVNAPKIPNSVSVMEGTFLGCTNLVNAPEIPNSVTIMGNTFRSCTKLVNVPTISNSVTNMYFTFYGCSNLVNAPVIPNSVTKMYYVFSGCSNLVNAPVIPNSVINIESIFQSCTNLVNAPVIPNSVINMGWAFLQCRNLINAPEIPNSVTNIVSTFNGCSNLVNAPEIPNSVTSMMNTFSYCNNLVNAPEIPNSVTNMYQTFYNCYNLVNAPIIPNSVTNIYQIFFNCFYLEGDIIIESENITNARRFFSTTSSSHYKNVYIPFQNNGVNTATFDAFIDAGYSYTERDNKSLLLFDLKTKSYINFNLTPNENTLKYLNGKLIKYNRCISEINNEYVLYNLNYPVVIGHINNLTPTNEYLITKDLTSVTGYTITLNVDQTDCNVFFYINDVRIPAIANGNNYSITLNTDEEINIKYLVEKEGYKDSEGTLTFNNNNIIQNVSMTLSTWTSWSQPILISNGTIGGNSFAVSSDWGNDPYLAFDDDYHTYFILSSIYLKPPVNPDETGYWKSLVLYNPKKLKISQIYFTLSSPLIYGTVSIYKLTIRGSNDNINWETISSTYSGDVNEGTLNITNPKGYKYYDMAIMNPPQTSNMYIFNINITAQEEQ